MGKTSRYVLRIKELPLGKREFAYEVDDAFFALFEGSEIQKGGADVHLSVDKMANMATLDFTIKGEVEVTCDRCLDAFMMPVDFKGTLYVKYSGKTRESDGEIMWISSYEPEIDLAQYIYESIWLSLPYQKIHAEDENGESGCDPEMLARFRIVSKDEFEEIVSETTGEADETNESSWVNQVAKLKATLEGQDKKEKE